MYGEAGSGSIWEWEWKGERWSCGRGMDLNADVCVNLHRLVQYRI